MNTINVLEVNDDSIVQLLSFDGNNPDEVERAEQSFIAIARENGYDGDPEELLNDYGYYSNDNWKLFIVWNTNCQENN